MSPPGAPVSSPIEVRLLGPFELVIAGQAVRIGSVKQRAVLALLALQTGKVVSSDTLCQLAWGENQPSSPSATLHSVVSRLRGVLGAGGAQGDAGRDVLRTRDPGWVLDVDPEAVDALRFARLTALARQRTGRGDVAAGAGDLAEAVGLWRGAALVDIVDAGYLGPQATRLNEARLDAVEDLAEAELSVGQHARALVYLEEHVEAHPLRERGWALLMVALYRLGRQAAALRAFQQLRAVLADELGLDPSPELVEIERRILNHDPTLSTPASPDGVALIAPHGDTSTPARQTVQRSDDAQATEASDGLHAKPAGEFVDYSVLVVEDHDFQRRTVVQLLRGLGVGNVTDASDGAEALRAFESGHVPDVVICDIDMPGMDGVEFVERLAESNLACGLVITSGLESNVLRAVETIGESQGIRVLAALEKPLTARRLGDVLRQYTRLKRENSDSFEHAPVSGNELRSALDSGQVTAQFQPRIDLATGAISGAQATGLWQTPDGRALPCAAFLPTVAGEEVLLAFVERIVAVSCVLLDDAVRAGIAIDRGMRVAINVSRLRFSDASLADRLTEMVRSRGHHPARFVWELDDVVLARASGPAIAVLTRLRVKGFGLSLLHTGSGPSFTSQLGRLPLTELKLDGRLVKASTSDATVFEMLEASLGSARDAGIRVVAEGCDGGATFDALLSLGCSEAIGQFIGEPTTASELVSRMLAGYRSVSLT